MCAFPTERVVFQLLCSTPGFPLTKNFEEELPLLRPRLVGGLASIAAPIALADVADGQHAAPAFQPVDNVLL